MGVSFCSKFRFQNLGVSRNRPLPKHNPSRSPPNPLPKSAKAFSVTREASLSFPFAPPPFRQLTIGVSRAQGPSCRSMAAREPVGFSSRAARFRGAVSFVRSRRFLFQLGAALLFGRTDFLFRAQCVGIQDGTLSGNDSRTGPVSISLTSKADRLGIARLKSAPARTAVFRPGCSALGRQYFGEGLLRILSGKTPRRIRGYPSRTWSFLETVNSRSVFGGRNLVAVC